MLAKTPALLALAFVLAGCSEKPPTFVLWEITDVYVGGVEAGKPPTRTSVRQIEGGLDRVACELIQTKHQQEQEKYHAFVQKHDRDMVNAGLPVPKRDYTTSVYRCLRTGVEPEKAPS